MFHITGKGWDSERSKHCTPLDFFMQYQANYGLWLKFFFCNTCVSAWPNYVPKMTSISQMVRKILRFFFCHSLNISNLPLKVDWLNFLWSVFTRPDPRAFHPEDSCQTFLSVCEKSVTFDDVTKRREATPFYAPFRRHAVCEFQK